MSSRDEGIIDVERRKESIEYNFGDPTLFPPEFLNWLKRFIEQSGITLPASAIFGSLVPGGGSGTLRNIAAGVIVPFAGPVAPAGSIPCDGQLELINDFPKLHEVIGNTWGPETATTFTIPDLRGRSLYGAGGALALGAVDAHTLAQRGARHRHTVNDPGHGHSGGTFGAVHPPFNGNFLLQNGSQNLNAAEGAGIGGATTGISVGPAGTPLDSPSHAIATYVITTG